MTPRVTRMNNVGAIHRPSVTSQQLITSSEFRYLVTLNDRPSHLKQVLKKFIN